jgi:hypothetical protein
MMESFKAPSVGLEIAQKMDAVIREEITKSIGFDWTIPAIAHRLGRIRFPGQESEIIVLDGEPLIEFWPPEITTPQDSNRLTVVVRYKIRRKKAA